MADFDYSTLRVVARGLAFPEGPVAHADGSLTVVEIEGDTVARIMPDGSVTRFACGRGPNGSAMGPDGALYVGTDGGLAFASEGDLRFPVGLAPDYAGGSIQRLDLVTGDVTTLCTEIEGVRIGGLNDIVFDAGGSAYFIDTAGCAIYYGDPVANQFRVATRELTLGNGAGLSPDGKTLFASETYSGDIVAFDVGADGALSDRRVIYTVGPGAHAFDGRWDGLAIDGAGNVCVANLGRSGISVIGPDGTLRGTFATPEHDTNVTNICFGGPDGDTAFICSSGRGILYSIRWPWPGLKLNFAG